MYIVRTLTEAKCLRCVALHEKQTDAVYGSCPVTCVSVTLEVFRSSKGLKERHNHSIDWHPTYIHVCEKFCTCSRPENSISKHWRIYGVD